MPLKPFQPGQSGNPGGRKKKPMVDRMLEEILTANDSAKAKQVANRLISSALKGSVPATKIIIERTEGRAMRNVLESAQDPATSLTREEVRRRLAEILNAPEVRESVVAILSAKPEGKVLQ